MCTLGISSYSLAGQKMGETNSGNFRLTIASVISNWFIQTITCTVVMRDLLVKVVNMNMDDGLYQLLIFLGLNYVTYQTALEFNGFSCFKHH